MRRSTLRDGPSARGAAQGRAARQAPAEPFAAGLPGVLSAVLLAVPAVLLAVPAVLLAVPAVLLAVPAVLLAVPVVLIAVLTGLALLPGPTPLQAARDMTLAELIRIPAGTWRLGSDEREKGYGYAVGSAAAWRNRWFQGERARTVTLAAYDIEATPVTQRAYAAFVAASGRRAPHIGEADYVAQGFLVHPYVEVRPYLWQGGRPPAGRAEHPVVLVSHADAGAYCAWRGRMERRSCRLPGEDEWERAARGGDGRYYPWGNVWDPARVNTAERGPYGTTPVRDHPQGRSREGLYDMAGNVFEWSATLDEPGRPVLKGCSWDDAGGICRAAARHARPAASRHILIGFRCACDAAASHR